MTVAQLLQPIANGKPKRFPVRAAEGWNTERLAGQLDEPRSCQSRVPRVRDRLKQKCNERPAPTKAHVSFDGGNSGRMSVRIGQGSGALERLNRGLGFRRKTFEFREPSPPFRHDRFGCGHALTLSFCCAPLVL